MNDRVTRIDNGLYDTVADEFGDGLPDILRARVKAELESGERLIWAAGSHPPIPRLGVGFFVWCLIALVLLAAGAVVYGRGLHRGPRHGDGDPATLGIVLISVGVMIAAIAGGSRIGKRFEQARQRGVFYAVTDRRAISWLPEAGSDAIRIRSLHRGQIADVVRVERPNGSGSLEFLLAHERHEHYWNHEGFSHVPEVRRVEQIIRQQLISIESTA